MRRTQRALVRILRGPTGGLVASLGLAAFLGGVAIAAPGVEPTPVAGQRGASEVAASASSSEHAAIVSLDGGLASDVRPDGGPSSDHAGRSPAGATKSHGSGSDKGTAAGERPNAHEHHAPEASKSHAGAQPPEVPPRPDPATPPTPPTNDRRPEPADDASAAGGAPADGAATGTQRHDPSGGARERV